MKSESGSAPAPKDTAHKWRLSRTLRRETKFRPIEAEDIRYAWAAYKKGGLDGFDKDLTPDQFRVVFEGAIIEHCHAAWTLFGRTKDGVIPVGMVFAAWAPNAPYLIVTGIVWMPWASKRNIIECTVGFFNEARKQLNFVGYATQEHKRMYEICCMHAVMRRVGTSYIAIPGKAAAVFETRT